MNCQTARQTLELFRPEEISPAISGEAKQHVNDCLDCQEAVRVQQQVDLRIGRVCRDVGIPAGLKDRLLAELAAADAAESGAASRSAGLATSSGDVMMTQSGTNVQPAVDRRRRWLVRSLVAAGIAVTAIGGIWFGTRPPTPTIALGDVTKQVLEANPDELNEFQAFRAGVVLKQPTTMNTTGLTKSQPRQLGKQDVAVYFFTLRRDGKSYHGRLMVMPLAAVIDLPAATSFLAEPPTYNPPYCTTAWVEKDKGFVYVLCVKKGDAVLLQQLLPRTV